MSTLKVKLNIDLQVYHRSFDLKYKYKTFLTLLVFFFRSFSLEYYSCDGNGGGVDFKLNITRTRFQFKVRNVQPVASNVVYLPNNVIVHFYKAFSSSKVKTG